MNKLLENIGKTGELPALRTEIDIPIKTLVSIGLSIIIITICVVLVQKISKKI